MNAKRIIMILLAIGLAGGIYGYLQWTKPHKDLNKANEDFKVSATDLFTQFSTDEAKANVQYLDKVIKVCGKVAVISTTEGGKTSVQLDTGDPIGGVMCELNANTAKESIKEGAEICMKGLCSGYLSDVVLNDCVIAQ